MRNVRYDFFVGIFFDFLGLPPSFPFSADDLDFLTDFTFAKIDWLSDITRESSITLPQWWQIIYYHQGATVIL